MAFPPASASAPVQASAFATLREIERFSVDAYEAPQRVYPAGSSLAEHNVLTVGDRLAYLLRVFDLVEAETYAEQWADTIAARLDRHSNGYGPLSLPRDRKLAVGR